MELETTVSVLPEEYSTASRETETEGAIKDDKARREGGIICWFAFFWQLILNFYPWCIKACAISHKVLPSGQAVIKLVFFKAQKTLFWEM